MIQLTNYIDGRQVAPASGQYLDNPEPATGQVYSTIPDSGREDVQAAVLAAKKAYPTWSRLPIQERADWMLRIAAEIARRAPQLAEAESRDNGKPLSLAKRVDIPRAEANFKFFGHAIAQFASESHHMAGQAINYTLRQSLGVVGCISPWNLPLYLFTWKIAPALAAGNTVVAKPSEVTPMTAYLLGKICEDLGLPAGVLNIVHGLGPAAGEAIVTHPAVKAISFTGGTRTGAAIAAKAAPVFKKLSLELGGKNPNLIFADCDYEQMLDTTLRSSFANQGQICLCGSRILVEKPIYERFVADFVARTKALVVGDPTDDVNLGAIVSKSHYEKILHYIELAKQEGGTVQCGGEAVSVSGRCEQGWFIQPTIITGLDQSCRTNQEEIFGPVVTIQSFETEAESLALANSVSYGLASTVWTSDLNRAHRIAEEIEAGIVWINCWLLRDLRTPFGGMKQSGVGREGGFEALRFFTEPKNVCVKYGG